MERFGRDEPLPSGMQGRWRDVEDATSELIIDGSEVRYLGHAVPYDYKEVGTVEDALTVSLKIDDETEEDDFQRSSITGLVITPEGDFYAYNVKFVSQFIRSGA